MPIVCPTVTESDPKQFNACVERIASYAQRIHLDFADGDFAPTKLMNLIQADWPQKLVADLHIMYREPLKYLETAISLGAYTTIVHVEAEGDLDRFIDEMHAVDLRVGVALLGRTEPEACSDLLRRVDHVLVFGGHLGYQGGELDVSSLEKVARIKEINSEAEMAWDGGIKVQNARMLVDAGIDVLNVGGFIKNADDPAAAYQSIMEVIA